VTAFFELAEVFGIEIGEDRAQPAFQVVLPE
jgi:hypothetical protein